MTRSRSWSAIKNYRFFKCTRVNSNIWFTPELMSITFIGSGIWMLVAMVVAVRQALDYESTWRAIGVVVIGFLVQAICFNNAIKNFWTRVK